MEILDAEPYLQSDSAMHDEYSVVRKVLTQVTEFREPNDETELICVTVCIPTELRHSRCLHLIDIKMREKGRSFLVDRLWVFVKSQFVYDGNIPIKRVGLVFRPKTILEDLVGY